MQWLLWRACTSLSLSLSLCLSLSIWKHGSDPDQTRRVYKIECFVNLKKKVHKALILWNVRLCRTKANAHDKFGFWALIGRLIDWPTLCFDILRNQAKTKDSCANTMQSLSLSLSTFTTCYQSLQTKIVRRVWSGTCLIRDKQAYQEL